MFGRTNERWERLSAYTLFSFGAICYRKAGCLIGDNAQHWPPASLLISCWEEEWSLIIRQKQRWQFYGYWYCGCGTKYIVVRVSVWGVAMTKTEELAVKPHCGPERCSRAVFQQGFILILRDVAVSKNLKGFDGSCDIVLLVRMRTDLVHSFTWATSAVAGARFSPGWGIPAIWPLFKHTCLKTMNWFWSPPERLDGEIKRLSPVLDWWTTVQNSTRHLREYLFCRAVKNVGFKTEYRCYYSQRTNFSLGSYTFQSRWQQDIFCQHPPRESFAVLYRAENRCEVSSAQKGNSFAIGNHVSGLYSRAFSSRPEFWHVSEVVDSSGCSLADQ